jgi:hypothetical protein
MVHLSLDHMHAHSNMRVCMKTLGRTSRPQVTCITALPTLPPTLPPSQEVELGIYDIDSAETSPILWHGEH